MIEYIFLSVYRFSFFAIEPIILSENNKGNILRSAFGRELKKIVCINTNIPCYSCSIINSCAYQKIFSPVVNSTSKGLKKNRDLPRGYIIKPPLEPKTIYKEGEIISFDMVLTGELYKWFPYILIPIKELGEIGIGKNRGKFKLLKVDIFNPENMGWEMIYSSNNSTVRNLNFKIGDKYIRKSCTTTPDEEGTESL